MGGLFAKFSTAVGKIHVSHDKNKKKEKKKYRYTELMPAIRPDGVLVESPTQFSIRG